MSKKASFFLTSIHHLLLRPRSFRSSLVSFDRDRSFLPFPVKNKIENTRRGFRGIPTIPNDDESFVPSSHVYTLDPPSKFRIIRFTPCSLSLSIFLPPISGTPLRSIRFDNRSPEKDFHIFPRPNIHFLSFSTHDFRHDSYHSPRTRFKFKISSSSPFKKTRYRIEAKRDKIFVRAVFRVPFSRQRISPLNKIRAETVESRGTQGRLPFGKDFVGICRITLSTRIER